MPVVGIRREESWREGGPRGRGEGGAQGRSRCHAQKACAPKYQQAFSIREPRSPLIAPDRARTPLSPRNHASAKESELRRKKKKKKLLVKSCGLTPVESNGRKRRRGGACNIERGAEERRGGRREKERARERRMRRRARTRARLSFGQVAQLWRL